MHAVLLRVSRGPRVRFEHWGELEPGGVYLVCALCGVRGAREPAYLGLSGEDRRKKARTRKRQEFFKIY